MLACWTSHVNKATCLLLICPFKSSLQLHKKVFAELLLGIQCFSRVPVPWESLASVVWCSPLTTFPPTPPHTGHPTESLAAWSRTTLHFAAFSPHSQHDSTHHHLPINVHSVTAATSCCMCNMNFAKFIEPFKICVEMLSWTAVSEVTGTISIRTLSQ